MDRSLDQFKLSLRSNSPTRTQTETSPARPKDTLKIFRNTSIRAASPKSSKLNTSKKLKAKPAEKPKKKKTTKPQKDETIKKANKSPFESKTLPNNSLVRDLQKLEVLTNPSSESTILKVKLKQMKQTVKGQKKALGELYDRVVVERKEVKNITEKFFNAKKNDIVVMELQERLNLMQRHETELMNELKKQQDHSSDLINKLEEIQIESREEINKSKQYYKTIYTDKFQTEIEQNREVIKGLQDENARLMARISELEQTQDTQEMNKSIFTNEVKSLKVKLEGKSREKAVLREEVARLKKELEEEQATKRQATNAADVELQLKEVMREMKVFKEQVGLRDEEFVKMEIYYKDRLEEAKKAQEEKRREWARVYNDLLVDLRKLKAGANPFETFGDDSFRYQYQYQSTTMSP